MYILPYIQLREIIITSRTHTTNQPVYFTYVSKRNLILENRKMLKLQTGNLVGGCRNKNVILVISSTENK